MIIIIDMDIIWIPLLYIDIYYIYSFGREDLHDAMLSAREAVARVRNSI